MGWIAGYHTHEGHRFYERYGTWTEARGALVDELDQRIMAIQAEPDVDRLVELIELEDGIRTVLSLTEGAEEDAAFDAGPRTFVLVPELAADLASFVESLVIEVLR